MGHGFSALYEQDGCPESVSDRDKEVCISFAFQESESALVGHYGEEFYW